MKLTKNRTSEYYICKRLKLLDFLLKKGFEVIDVVPDAKNPLYKCWRFKRTQAVLDAVDEYYSLKTTD